MARYKTKAEKNFEARFKTALNDRDWNRIDGLLTMFGHYYLLADGEELVGEETITTHVFDHTVRSQRGADLDYYRVINLEVEGV